MKTYTLTKSKSKNKKWNIKNGKSINFGQKGKSDFTIHKDPNRKKNYIARHKKNEDWSKTGIDTAGFWAKNLLWNKNTLSKSIIDTENRFNIDIIKKRK
jgi:hypothetical protein